MRTPGGARLLVAAALLAALGLPAEAIAVEGHDSGGTGGHGGDSTGSTGSLYADLVLAYRASDGTPVLEEFFTESTAEEEAAHHFCVQPASPEPVPGLTPTPNPLGGTDLYVLPLQGEWLDLAPEAVPVAEIEPCDVQPQYAMFVSEAELERLNLGRTDDDVLERKLSDVRTKFLSADAISLDAAGRLAVDGLSLDASPEYAAMYASLMETGSVPGLTTDASGLAEVSQEANGVPGFSYGPFELAAVAIGTAASKTVPLTVDTVQYYNRVVGFPAADPAPTWGIEFLQSADPVGDPDGTMPRDALPGSEKFVDYGDFTYDRSATFPGSVTWLDVPSLTWQVSRITDVVDFTEISADPVADGELTGLVGFSQMADDVRAVISFLHENEVMAGFHMDPVGVDTTADQERALEDAVVDLAGVPDTMFPGLAFPFTVSMYNPWKAPVAVDDGSLVLTVTGPEDLTSTDITITDGTVPPELVGTGGTLTARTSLPDDAGAGYRFEKPLDLTLSPEAPAGAYTMTLQLWSNQDGAGDATFLNGGEREVVDTAAFTVHEGATTLMWADDVAAIATQGASVKLPLRVFAPAADDVPLVVTVDGPGEPLLAAGDVSLYAFDGSTMQSVPLTPGPVPDTLTGTVTQAMSEGYNDLTMYLRVAEGAPVGTYTADLGLADPVTGVDLAEPVSIDVTAPVDHKSPSAPVVEEKTVDGNTVTIVVSSSATDVASYEFVLVKDFVHLEKATSTDGSAIFAELAPGTYKVNITAIDRAGNRSDTVATTFVIEATSGPGTPTAPPTDPGDTPEDPGDTPQDPDSAQAPQTRVVHGPTNGTWLLRHRVTYRLSSSEDGAVFRVRLDGNRLEDCSTGRCTLDGLTAGTHRVRFAAASDGAVDPTPVVRTFTVPRAVEQLRFTEGWAFEERDRAFGDVARTRVRGEVARTRAHHIRRIALVAARREGHGVVEVYLGQRLLKRVSLASRTTQHRAVIPVHTFAVPRRGVVRVVVAGNGKPVRIRGIGIADR